jgi:hypothetical protein
MGNIPQGNVSMKNKNNHNNEEHKKHKIYPKVHSHHQGALLPHWGTHNELGLFNPNHPLTDHKDPSEVTY